MINKFCLYYFQNMSQIQPLLTMSTSKTVAQAAWVSGLDSWLHSLSDSSSSPPPALHSKPALPQPLKANLDYLTLCLKPCNGFPWRLEWNQTAPLPWVHSQSGLTASPLSSPRTCWPPSLHLEQPFADLYLQLPLSHYLHPNWNVRFLKWPSQTSLSS